ncbi:MAG TPA: phosphate ABC transporter substrate-binding protein [Verrucomicrobiae bacterium]|jgi:phosphate transport system substrate-binding protein|nr:phosphate ABC transporter substrate-binding protein [Verrucomicrobiae bacterium]
MKIRNVFGSLALFSAFILFSSPAARAESLQIKGSDTMVNLGQAWAEEFMAQHPEVSIAVTGGGSGTGIAAIISGTCDIAQASRDITAEEQEKAKAGGSEIKETTVAYDGIAVVVHPSNSVEHLTIAQLADIFTGKVTNWKDVGGPDKQILVLSRERNSGTHVFFLEHVLRKGNAKGPEEYAQSALMMPSSQAIVQEVQSNEAAISYVGLGYVDNTIKVVTVSKDASAQAIGPSLETVQSGEYPISRPLLFLTRGEPAGSAKDFTGFVLSDAGQEIVKTLDFVPLKK